MVLVIVAFVAILLSMALGLAAATKVLWVVYLVVLINLMVRMTLDGRRRNREHRKFMHDCKLEMARTTRIWNVAMGRDEWEGIDPEVRTELLVEDLIK